MKITTCGSFFVGKLKNITYTEKDYNKLLAMANEEFTEELAQMLEEALTVADPAVLFGVCSVSKEDGLACVNGVTIQSSLAFEKLGDKNRCFPYIGTCGRALEKWSEQYSGDMLAEYWADEIKKYFLRQVSVAFHGFLKTQYHMTGHIASLNPGSIAAWPISGQQELFAILGGREFVQEQIGVIYTPSFLMLPSKSVSGIVFESETFYENCQYCPLIKCPNRRAKRLETGEGANV